MTTHQLCAAPVGLNPDPDSRERVQCGQQRPCPVHDQPSAAPAQPAQDAPAAAAPTPGTTGPAILGRALLDRHGTLWQDDAPLRNDVDMLKAGATYVTRSYAENYGGPLRPVLLVDPAVARVLDAAAAVLREWRHPTGLPPIKAMRAERRDSIAAQWEELADLLDDALAAAVDALGEPAGTPPADTPAGDSIDPATIPDQRAKNWADWHPETYCHRCGRRNIWSWYADSAVWNEAEGDGGGILCPVCFVADHERVTGARTSWRLAPAGKTDEVGHLVRSEAEMRHQLDTARAELDTASSQATSRWQRIIELRAELATARRHAEYRATDGPGWDRYTVEGVIDRSCADATGEELDQLRALLDDVDQYEGWAERLAEHIPEEEGDDVATPGLVEQWMARQPALREEIRRDAAADALVFAAGLAHRWSQTELAGDLRHIAAEIRAGTRSIGDVR
jgi:hypothetical protein